MSESIWDDPRITAYVLGELPEQERIEFENELESDSELAAAVEEARSVTGQLESLYASEATATLDDQRREAIVLPQRANDVATTPSIPGPEFGSWKVPLLVLAMAASLLVLIGVRPWLNQRNLAVSELGDNAAMDAAMETATDEIEELEIAMEEFDASEATLTERSATEAFVIQTQPQPQLQAEAQSQGVASPVAGPVPAGDDQEQLDRTVGQSAAGPKVKETREALSVLESQTRQQDQTLPALPDVALSVQENEAKRPQLEFMSEREAIILRGSKRDLDRVERVIMESESVADAVVPVPAQATPAEAPSPAPAPTSSPAPERKKRLADKYRGDDDRPLSLAKDRRMIVDAEESRSASDRNLALLGTQPKSGADQASLADSRHVVPPAIRTAGAAEGITRNAPWGTSLDREEPKQIRRGPVAPDYSLPIEEGRGPGIAGDRFDPITDNPFKRVSEHPLSTFSVDVDTASYSKTRDFLLRAGRLPRPDAVRIEELLNYFDYNYLPPSATDEHPFASRVTVTSCPWNKQHRLARIALKGKTMDKGERPPCNLVFLLDTSGSMKAPNKLPLVIDGMQMLLKELNQKDKVAITVYAGSAGLVLDSTSAKKRKKIRKALTQLSAGGSTNGGAGIALAYQTARDNFITDGVNRVILCTDGDFNVGTTGTDELVRMVEKEAKGGVFLSVFGFGMGNHNDAMLEKISGRGNGNYAFIDNDKEARKVLVDQTSGTLVTIAKDVKLQIEFNPLQVASYRLIGYENRVLAKEDFYDDKKDAGEIGAGHAVTALYEIVPAGVEADASRPKVDDLKYQSQLKPSEAATNDEMLTLKLCYKQPDGETSTLVEFPVTDQGGQFDDADEDVRFAAAVAGFGMQLRRSEYAGDWTLNDVLQVARQAQGQDKYDLRAEFVDLVRKAKELMGQE